MGRADFFEFRADCFDGDAESLRGLLCVGIREHGVAGFVQCFAHRAHDAEAAFVLTEIVRGAQVVQIKIEEAFCSVDQLLERRAAGFLDETVRVMRGRHGGDANGEAGRQQIVQRTDRGIATSRVRVEAKH